LGRVAGKTSIRLCGRFSAEVEGRTLDDLLPGRQGRLLFAYLAASGGRAVPREQLIDALWPERLPKDPAAAFSVVLSKLRRSVGADLVQGSAELRLALPGGRIDVVAAEQAVAAARSALEQRDWPAVRKQASAALEALDGEFLVGSDAPWIEDRRRELESVRLEALELVGRAGLALGGGALMAAERAARELVERSPYRESGYALLMETVAARGDVAEALLVFDRLRVLLRDQLGVSPSAALQELHATLLEGRHPRVPADRKPDTAWIEELPLPRALERLAPSTFVGRQAELARLVGCWERVLSGECVVALVSGEPGIGKTRLLAELSGRLRTSGAGVLYGAMEQHARLDPYEPIADALRGLADQAPPGAFAAACERGGTALFRLAPEFFDRAPDVHEHAGQEATLERQRLFQAIDLVLRELAAATPVLLALDDLHWADQPALALLRHIARSAADAPLLITATYRHTDLALDHPLTPALADLRRLGTIEDVSLSGLQENDIAELVAAMTGRDDRQELASGLYAATDGNPLFVTEALRHVSEGTPLEAALGGVPGPLSGGVKQVIAGRLSRLGEPSRRALSAASVIGREFELAVLERAAGVEGDDLLDALEEALAAGLLLEAAGRPGRFSFSHALVRDFLYGSLSGVRRSRLHGRIGRELERFHRGDLEPHLGELAQHFLESARLGANAEKAFHYALAAGRRAADLFAWEEAEARYRAVLTELEDTRLRLPASPRRRCARAAREGLADALATRGRYEEAVDTYHAGLADSVDEPLCRARLHRKAGMALVRLHHYGQAHDAFDAAERTLEEAPASAQGSDWRRERAQIMLDRIPILYWEDRVRDMEAIIERARPLVDSDGTPAQRARLLESRCQLGLRRERYAPSDETMWLIEAALAASEEAGWSHGALWAKEGLGFCRLWRGDLDGAREALADALAAAERYGEAAVAVRCLAYLTVVARRRRDLEATTQLAERTIAVAESSNAATYVASSKANLAWVAWRKGELAKARALAREALDIWNRLPSEYMFRWLAVWPLAAADTAYADGDEALREAARLLEHGQQALAEPLERLVTEAVSLHTEGRMDEAQNALRGALELAEELALA
jgi:DNA-binding SARP family transcriptional activator